VIRKKNWYLVELMAAVKNVGHGDGTANQKELMLVRLTSIFRYDLGGCAIAQQLLDRDAICKNIFDEWMQIQIR